MTSTVTHHTDMNPSPRVDISIDPADVTADEITIWQVSAQGKREVRDAIRVDASGEVFVTDHEVPFNVPVSYRVQQFVDGVETGWVLDLPTTITFSGTVISDPQVPDLAVSVGAEYSFAGSLKKSRAAQRYVAGGRTVALMGRQSLYEGVPLKCWTDTFEQSQLLRDVLEVGTVLVRSAVTSLPPAFYCIVADVPEVPFDYRNGGETLIWDLVADEVTRNTLPILRATVTWDRVVAAYATWDALKAAHPTWLDIIKNPPPEA